MGERTGTLVAPAISFTFSGGGLPGTINVSPAVMSLLVQDVLGSLALQGFRQFYLVLAHGGSENLTALGDALKILLRTNPLFDQALIACSRSGSSTPRASAGARPSPRGTGTPAGWRPR